MSEEYVDIPTDVYGEIIQASRYAKMDRVSIEALRQFVSNPPTNELVLINVTSDDEIATKRWPGTYAVLTNGSDPSSVPVWKTATYDSGDPLTDGDPIEIQVLPLDDEGVLTKGRYLGFSIASVQDLTTDPNGEDDPDPDIPAFIAVVGSGATSAQMVPLVHAVAGPDYPPAGTDFDDWFCTVVYRGNDGLLHEQIPRKIYGKGLVDEDGTGWVYEGSGSKLRIVDPDDVELNPTHAIPIFRDVLAPVDEDGPIYVIEWAKYLTNVECLTNGELKLTY